MLNKHFLFFLLLLPLAFAFGGDTELVSSIPECHNLSITVNGSLPIDSGEYSILDCNETFNNTWFCECNNSFEVLMDFKLNTINNYSLKIIVDGEDTVPATPSSPSSGTSSGGGGSSSTSSWSGNCAAGYELINNSCTKLTKSVANVSKSTIPRNITVDIVNESVVEIPEVSENIGQLNEPVPESEIEISLWVILVFISVIILGLYGLYRLYIWWGKRKEDEDNY